MRNGAGVQMLHRLVRRPILAQADAVVGKDEDGGISIQRGRGGSAGRI